MRTKRIATTILALGMLASTATLFAQQGYPPPPPQNYGQPYGQQPGYGPPQGPPPQPWEGVPPEFRAAQQRGFHDGVEGARKDFANHRPPNVNNRDEFRHPNFIPGPDRRDYRYGFKQGYNVAVQHIYGPAPRY